MLALESAQVRLQCQSPVKGRRGSQCSKGKPQNGAYISATVQPPPGFKLWPLEPIEIQSDDEDTPEISPTSCAPTTPGFSDDAPPREEDWEGLRRRLKPYSLDSDGEHEPIVVEEPEPYKDDPPNYFDDDPDEAQIIEPGVFRLITRSPWEYVAASILPMTMTEKILVPEPLHLEHWWERAISKLTLYRNFKFARTQEEFEMLQDAIRNEWSFAGGSLAAICG